MHVLILLKYIWLLVQEVVQEFCQQEGRLLVLFMGLA